jgi:carbonic anhydrase/acetyltransferase-like protein (isoleucine patch superfamily)
MSLIAKLGATNAWTPVDRRLEGDGSADPMTLIDKFGSFLALPWLEKTQRIAEFYWLLKTQVYYRCFWGHIGKRSKLIQPMRLRNVQNIRIGDDVIIRNHAFLLTLQEDESVIPSLIFGDGCRIGHMNHITCINEVRIGKNVLTADRVYISDHSHDFLDTKAPILSQPAVSKGKVSIGDGTWIGENVVVLSCSIGRHCVLGANAVVLHDVPDFSVAVGIPARVVQRFDPASQSWVKVKPL